MDVNTFGCSEKYPALVALTVNISELNKKDKSFISSFIVDFNKLLKNLKIENQKDKLYLLDLIHNDYKDKVDFIYKRKKIPSNLITHLLNYITAKIRELKRGEKNNVLSLFDGMSCGQIALNKVGIEYDEYFASEIDKEAIKVTMKNYPNTKQVGSITELKGSDLPKIDLLFGGSPCQSFSRAGDNSGFDGSSKLFWEFVRVLNEVKPTYFLLENVIMKKEWEDVITEALGVKPIEITSAKFVPQARRRLYWTNIPNVIQPTQAEYNVLDFIDGDGFPTSCGIDRVFKRKQIFNTLTATYWRGIRGSGRPAVSIREGF